MTDTEPALDHLDRALSAAEVRRAYTEMQDACPVVHSTRHGGFDFLTRYRAVRSALGDPETYSSADGVHIPPTGLPPTPALEHDGAEHAEWRELLNGPLTVRATRALEPMIREVVDVLIDGFCTAGRADLVVELAEPLPAIVIGRMIGLDHPESLRARALASTLFASVGTDEFPVAMAAFAEGMDMWLTQRREHPRDDLLSAMARGVVDGKEIDDAGAIGLVATYLVGGHHSTGSGLAGLFRHVLTDPELRDSLIADRGMLSRVVEESLRLTTPLQLFARTVRRPVEIDDETLPTGRRVMLNLASANRDPRRFDDPDRFDPRRTRNRHLAFGAGPHVCPGQHVARAELRIALERLLDRVPDVRCDGEPVESGLIGGSLMTHYALPVSFTPERAGRTQRQG